MEKNNAKIWHTNHRRRHLGHFGGYLAVLGLSRRQAS
jgi:hypothetical protein